jgi:hypothetical protein
LSFFLGGYEKKKLNYKKIAFELSHEIKDTGIRATSFTPSVGANIWLRQGETNSCLVTKIWVCVKPMHL